MGDEERSDSVGIFVAEKWVDSVVSVERHSKRVLILKMVLDSGLLNILTVYAPHSEKPEKEKESFWNNMFHLVSCIPQNETVVLAGDMNGHAGNSNVGYDGDRNADGSRILEFADGLNLGCVFLGSSNSGIHQNISSARFIELFYFQKRERSLPSKRRKRRFRRVLWCCHWGRSRRN